MESSTVVAATLPLKVWDKEKLIEYLRWQWSQVEVLVDNPMYPEGHATRTEEGIRRQFEHEVKYVKGYVGPPWYRQIYAFVPYDGLPVPLCNFCVRNDKTGCEPCTDSRRRHGMVKSFIVDDAA